MEEKYVAAKTQRWRRHEQSKEHSIFEGPSALQITQI